MKILSIDPSIQEIGVCKTLNGKYVESYTVRTKAENKLNDRCEEICKHFSKISEPFDVVLIERPDKFVRMGKYSMLNMNSIQLLMVSIGLIFGSLIGRYNVRFVRVSEWKSGTTKKLTQITAKHLSGKKLNSHEADAFIMGSNWARFQGRIRR